MNIELTSDYKVKVLRNGLLKEIFCPSTNSDCCTRCAKFPEPQANPQSQTIMVRTCGNSPAWNTAPEDFADNRPTE